MSRGQMTTEAKGFRPQQNRAPPPPNRSSVPGAGCPSSGASAELFTNLSNEGVSFFLFGLGLRVKIHFMSSVFIQYARTPTPLTAAGCVAWSDQGRGTMRGHSALRAMVPTQPHKPPNGQREGPATQMAEPGPSSPTSTASAIAGGPAGTRR